MTQLPAIPHASTTEKMIVGRLVDDLIAADPICIKDDYGCETSVVRVYADTLLELRRYVREHSPGEIPIYSDYDCTGLVCFQSAKIIKIWRTHGGYTALVEFNITRDV